MLEKSSTSNIGIDTNLFIASYGGNVNYTRNYVAVTFPHAKKFYFGNYIVLHGKPSDSDLSCAEAWFGKDVGSPPYIQHVAFSWSEHEESGGPLPSPGMSGYEYFSESVLTARRSDLDMSRFEIEGIVIRPFASGEDWSNWLNVQAYDSPDFAEVEDYFRFVHAHQRMYKSLVDSNQATWWGAFIGEDLVSTAGVVFSGKHARFQSVYTVPNHRGKGICKALLKAAINDAIVRAMELVIVADEDYFAFDFYKKLGFKSTARIGNLLKILKL